MRIAKWPLLWSAVFAGHLAAQSFEVASIKRAPPPAASGSSVRVSSRMSVNSGRVLYTNVALRDVTKVAYSIRDDQVVAPAWLAEDRWDIIAKIPEGVDKSNVPAMLQVLLADRFKLAVHWESKELPSYVLAIAKNGLKIQPAEALSGLNMDMGPSGMSVKGQMDIARLSDFLSRQLGRAVVDQTGLKGTYQVSLEWSLDLAPGAADGPGRFPSLVTAVQEQLGLKLTAQRETVELVVVDHIERIPTQN